MDNGQVHLCRGARATACQSGVAPPVDHPAVVLVRGLASVRSCKFVRFAISCFKTTNAVKPTHVVGLKRTQDVPS